MHQSAPSGFLGLPQELRDEIIGYLRTDRDTLKACSLSHSSFLAVCQKWLFAMVALRARGGYDKSNGQNFKTLLQDSPHLANYIQCIKLVEYDWEGKQWLPQDTTLLTTLPLLRKLSSLYLRSSREDSWRNISTNLINCFSDVLRSPSLEYVSLEYAPLQLLENAGPSLKHISLKYISVAEFHPPPPNPHKELLFVESLQILDPRDIDMKLISDWFQRTDNNLSLKRLRRLYVSQMYGPRSSPHLGKILDACQLSLKELVYAPRRQLETQGLREFGPDDLDISRLASLRALRVRFDVSVIAAQGLFFNPFPWLIKRLDSLPPSNIVEELSFCVHLQQRLDPGTLQAWQEVGKAIIRNLKCLRSIEIHVNHLAPDSYVEEILQNTRDLQSTGFFRLLRADRPYEYFSAFPPFSPWGF